MQNRIRLSQHVSGTRFVLLPVILVTVLATSAAGQSKVLTLFGPAGAQIGAPFATAGDLDGDDVPDCLAGDPYTGVIVQVFSGSDGNVLHTFTSQPFAFGFGDALAGGHDVDGDAVPDILIGSFFSSAGGSAAGTVYVYSGATWGLIRQHDGAAGQDLGHPAVFLDDLDGDGVVEYGAGATHEGLISGPPEPGEAYVYSGASGAVLHHLASGAAGGQFGESLAAIGDVDGDGVSDLCIGEPSVETQGLFLNGKIWVASGASGQTLFTVEGPNDLASYGYRLAATGDADLDGIPDFATVAYDWAAFTNRVAVLSGASGGVLSYIESPLAVASGLQSGVGQFLDTVSDLDGDGFREVLVPYYYGGIQTGHALVAGAEDGELLYYLQEPPGSSVFPGALANAGDRDGDGRDEIATSRGDNTVTIYTTRRLVATSAVIPHDTGGAATFELNGGIPHAGAPYFLLASLTPTGVSCGGTPIGSTVIPLCYDLLMQFSILLVNVPPFVNTAGHLDALSGQATAAFDLTGKPLPASTIGITLWFAYIAKGGAAEFVGGPWTLASNAEPVLIF